MSKKGFTTIFVAVFVLVILVIGVAGYYLSSSVSSNGAVDKNQNELSGSKASDPLPISGSTSSPSVSPNQTMSIPTIGVPVATPNVVLINTPTPVTVSVEIADSVIPLSVNLLRLTSTSSVILAQLVDDGTGTHTFVGHTQLAESESGPLGLQVSAAFPGLLKRVFSVPTTLSVVSPTSTQYSSETLLFSYPQDFILSTLQPPVIGQTISLSNITRDPLAGGYGVPMGCQIDFRTEPNPNQLTASQWMQVNYRTDGTDVAVSFGGSAGIQKTFTDSVSGDPAESVTLTKLDRTYVFATTGPSCMTILNQILGTVILK